MQIFIVKVETETNKIVEVIKFDGSLDELMDEGNKRNQSCGEDFRYLPMPNCKKEPKIGEDATTTLRYAVGMPSEDKLEEHKMDVDKCIKLLISTQMTIRGTHIVPIPGVTAEQADSALTTVVMIMIALKIMQDRHEREQQEKKDTISDLFKKLGIKGE